MKMGEVEADEAPDTAAEGGRRWEGTKPST